MDFSVLMSIYQKENPSFLRESLQSIAGQTCPPAEIIMVEDGPLTPALYAVLDEFQTVLPQMRRLPQAQNQGLGKALNIGLAACSFPLVARMDTDDIALPHRFEQQTAAFAADPNPFNHPTVMFKKQAVLDAGGYQHAMWFEDYYLWARMLANGARAANIDDYLLYFRASGDMYKRRGGIRYVRSALSVKWKIYRLGVSGLGDFICSGGAHIVVGLMPNGLRKRFYGKFLRK